LEPIQASQEGVFPRPKLNLEHRANEGVFIKLLSMSSCAVVPDHAGTVSKDRSVFYELCFP